MGRTSPPPLFGLAPGGVCRASLSPGCWWALTLRDRSPPTFSPLPRGGGGRGKRSHGPQPVDLEKALPAAPAATQAVFFLLHFPYPSPILRPQAGGGSDRTVGITHHRVLWSPDFPLPGRAAVETDALPGSDRPAGRQTPLHCSGTRASFVVRHTFAALVS